jgi:hypothetical protein
MLCQKELDRPEVPKYGRAGRVAKAHGGQAAARARPDGGLKVQVTLPAIARQEKLRNRVEIAAWYRRP